jgi:hypothetical protein
MKNGPEILQEETTITEISIRPDGRIFVFGTSRQVLDVLERLNPQSPVIRQILDGVRAQEAQKDAQSVTQ